jgi:hypothetical protein
MLGKGREKTGPCFHCQQALRKDPFSFKSTHFSQWITTPLWTIVLKINRNKESKSLSKHIQKQGLRLIQRTVCLTSKLSVQLSSAFRAKLSPPTGYLSASIPSFQLTLHLFLYFVFFILIYTTSSLFSAFCRNSCSSFSSYYCINCGFLLFPQDNFDFTSSWRWLWCSFSSGVQRLILRLTPNDVSKELATSTSARSRW